MDILLGHIYMYIGKEERRKNVLFSGRKSVVFIICCWRRLADVSFFHSLIDKDLGNVLFSGSYVYSIHVELPPRIGLMHCSSVCGCMVRGYMVCAVDFSRGFWYGTLPCPIIFKGAKLLAASTNAVEWYKSHIHASFESEVLTCTCTLYVCQLYVNSERSIL